MEQTRGLQLAFAQLQSDCASLATTSLLNNRAYMLADNDRLTFVRVVMTENEPTRLQVVAYRVRDGVLTNPAGMTLYVFDKDTAGSGKSACNAECAKKWPAFAASASDTPSGDYTVVTRDDGSQQWAFRGKPLYLWVKDQKPGDTTGDGMVQLSFTLPIAATLTGAVVILAGSRGGCCLHRRCRRRGRRGPHLALRQERPGPPVPARGRHRRPWAGRRGGAPARGRSTSGTSRARGEPSPSPPDTVEG